MADKKLSAVSNLKIERSHAYQENDGVKFKASWKKVNSNTNTANKLSVEWNFEGKNGFKKHVDESGEKITDTNDSHTLKYSTYSKNAITKAKVTVTTSDGKDKKTASKKLVFATPSKPIVSLSYDSNKGVTCSVKSHDDQDFSDNGTKICTHINMVLTRDKVTKKSEKQARSTTGVNSTLDEETDPTPVNEDTVHHWHAEAYCIGIAGNSGVAKADLYFSKPLRPYINSVYKISSGIYRINLDARATTKHPVDSVTVRYIDIDQNEQPTDAAWSNASTAQESFTPGVKYITTNNIGGVAEGKKRIFKIVTKHFLAEGQSVNFTAEYGKPKPVQNLHFSHEANPPAIAWTLPEIIDETATFIATAEGNGKTITKTLANNKTEVVFTDIKSDYLSYRYSVYVKAGSEKKGFVSSDIEMIEPPTAPNKPTNVKATQFDTYDGAEISWNNQKDNTDIALFVDGCEVAWSEDPFAWQSNNPPTTYTFETPGINSARITGLDAGNRYFFWVRLYDIDSEGEKRFSPWSDLTDDSTCNMSDAPSTPLLTLSRAWAKPDSEPLMATWDYYAIGAAPLESSLITVTKNGETVWNKTLANGELSCDIPIADFKIKDLGEYRVTVSVGNAEASSASLATTLNIVDDPKATLTSSDFVARTEDGETELFLTNRDMLTAATIVDGEEIEATYKPTLTVGGSGEKTLTVFVPNTPTAIEMPDGFKSIYAGDVVYSARVENGNVTIPRDLPFIDGVTYRAQVTSVDQDTLLASDTDDASSFIDFTVDWDVKAKTPPVSASSVTIKRDENNATYAEIAPVAPSNGSSTDVCDVYRATADGYIKCLDGVAFGHIYRDYYPVYGWEGCAYRFVTRTDLGSVEWNDAPYRYENYNLTLDWGESIEMRFNVNASDSRSKSFEARTHMGGSKALYFSKGINRTTSISTQLVRGLDDAKIESLYGLSRHEGSCLIRLPYGIEYAGNVDVGIDTEFGSPIVNIKLDITETDIDNEFMAEEEE